uniref:Transmembrane protein 128 n=1 Tax=Kalanchoe fedtschenkoi TaxID=63787 RepID=A0A7N0ZZQ6_KALFE
MSGGTPVAGGLMRQRHSQGYASSGDDLEDDASSRYATTFFAPAQKQLTWVEVSETVLWIASAAFIIYYGDRHSNFIYLLWHDDRIRRLPLYLGMVSVLVNVLIFFYTSVLAWSFKAGEKVELLNPSTLPLVTLLGVVSFCLFAFSLWPIWSFLTIPLLFTLLMALVVIAPSMMMGSFTPQNLL